MSKTVIPLPSHLVGDPDTHIPFLDICFKGSPNVKVSDTENENIFQEPTLKLLGPRIVPQPCETKDCPSLVGIPSSNFMVPTTCSVPPPNIILQKKSRGRITRGLSTQDCF